MGTKEALKVRRGGLCVGQVVLLAAAGTLVWDKVLAAGGGEPGGRAYGQGGGSGGLGAGRSEAQTPLALVCFLPCLFSYAQVLGSLAH